MPSMYKIYAILAEKLRKKVEKKGILQEFRRGMNL